VRKAGAISAQTGPNGTFEVVDDSENNNNGGTVDVARVTHPF
jgi:hypothetical protein